MNETDADILWYPPTLDVFLNRWFSSYEEARKALEAEGGYLLPYRHQFFICQPEAIRAMGLEPDDPDWERIGRDGAKPANSEAFQRLKAKRKEARARTNMI